MVSFPSEWVVGARARFALGVVAGAAGALLLVHPEDEPPPPPRRFLRRVKQEPSPATLSDVVHDEAANLVRGVFRELGSAATRLILDLTAPLPEPEGNEDGDTVADPS